MDCILLQFSLQFDQSKYFILHVSPHPFTPIQIHSYTGENNYPAEYHFFISSNHSHTCTRTPMAQHQE